MNKELLQEISLPQTIEVNLTQNPERVLQFGEGNFLRAFADFFIDELNEKSMFNGSIVIAQPIAHGLADKLSQQDCLYTAILRGIENGKPVDRRRIVSSISRALNPYANFEDYFACAKNPDLRFVISNTTEAGITYVPADKLDDKPQSSFPGKVTSFLYERYKAFSGAADKGLIFIPCELIDDNGDALKQTVIQHADNWGLPGEFKQWVNTSCEFTNTLVDRIVTGYPKDEIETLTAELGYKDELIVTGEIFHFFAIQARKEWMPVLEAELPLPKFGLNVVYTEDVTPYKQRKVRILNGAHTMSVLAAYLAGKETVGEMMEDPRIIKYLQDGIYNEIIPTLDLDKADLESFAASVFDRFKNPHIKHFLLSIALNSVSKFKARVLPSILEYHKRVGGLPKNLTFSLAALIAFYKGDKANDDACVLEFFKEVWQGDNVVEKVCSNVEFWGADLTAIPGLVEKVEADLQNILQGEIF